MAEVVITALQHLLARLRFLYAPGWLAEFVSGCSTALWGGLALWGNPTPIDWPTMDLMLQVSDTDIWGWTMLALGIGQIAVFRAVDRKWSRSWLRWFGAIVVGWLWAVITISACRVTPWVPGLSAFFGMFEINFFLIFRIFWARP